ncbi:MAG: hypothetical protein WBX37_16615, partial [Pseudolabrys sp.]
RGSRPLFVRSPKADWLELLIQIAPRQATRGLRQSGQRQRRRPFLAQQEAGAFYSTLAKSRHLHRMAQFHPLYVGAITGAGRTIVASRILAGRLSGRGRKRFL